jgi:hypothetical protein
MSQWWVNRSSNVVVIYASPNTAECYNSWPGRAHLTITDPHHFLFGHRLSVVPERSARGSAYVVVALPDGRRRSVRIASTNLVEAPTMPGPDIPSLPRISARTLIPLMQHLSANLSLLDDKVIRDGPPTPFRSRLTEPPKLNKGETIIEAVERFRRRVRELKADLHRIQSAPFPSTHAKTKMRAQIEALAQRGAPDVTNLIEHEDGEIIWPTLRLRVDVLNAQPGAGAVAFVEIPDTVGMTAWRHKSEWIAELDAEINTEADDPAALTHEARQKAEAEVQADLLEAKRTEAALVFAAWEHGLACEHRSDINPVALLGLRLTTAPRGDASPETSPGYSWPWRR